MKRRVILAIATGLVFHSLTDVLLWQRIFEKNELWNYGSQYQAGWMNMLLGVIAVGMVLLWDNYEGAIFYALSLYTLAFSGLEDILYYVLDGRAIPSVLPWLEENRLVLFHPVTSVSLIASAVVWVMVWIILGVLVNYSTGRRTRAEVKVKK